MTTAQGLQPRACRERSQIYHIWAVTTELQQSCACRQGGKICHLGFLAVCSLQPRALCKRAQIRYETA